MEAGLDRRLWLILAFVLLMRAPFFHGAVQGDDHIYLSAAEHALIEPLHPNNTPYVFRGEVVDLRGHPHGPMVAWVLAGLIAVFGEVREVPFHAAFTVFSLIAAAGMWSLAKRFSPNPLWATLLFLAVPAFVINGNSFETDVPFLAFWMSSVALFVSGRRIASAVTMGLAALTAYQAIFLTPILWLYLWLFDRKRRAAWLIALTPVLTVVAYQIFERASTGAVPAAVLTGYFKQYGFQNFDAKLRSALGLTIHACWLIFPALLS